MVFQIIHCRYRKLADEGERNPATFANFGKNDLGALHLPMAKRRYTEGWLEPLSIDTRNTDWNCGLIRPARAAGTSYGTDQT
jgi:hypothetical protein